jgi:hypothetical protein
MLSKIAGVLFGGINELEEEYTPTMKLTAKKCETAKRDTDGAKLSDGGGLYLELHKNGSKYWRYKYRILGKEKVLALGVYPEVTLAEAREEHKKAHKLVSQGFESPRFAFYPAVSCRLLTGRVPKVYRT